MAFAGGNEVFSAGAILDNPLTAALCAAGTVYCFAIEPRLGTRPAGFDLPLSLREQLVATCLLAAALVVGFSQFTIPFLYFQF
jgi:hypothetical protein